MKQSQKSNDEDEKILNEDFDALNALPTKRPRLRSILKTDKAKDINIDQNNKRKSVQFAEDPIRVYRVVSYKKYNANLEENQKKCCLCTIF